MSVDVAPARHHSRWWLLEVTCPYCGAPLTDTDTQAATRTNSSRAVIAGCTSCAAEVILRVDLAIHRQPGGRRQPVDRNITHPPITEAAL